jgi:hypothetical protein
MIYTSYFAKLKSLPDNVIPISICAKTPSWYGGLQYKKLAPKYDFFMKWKENHDNDYFIKCFNEQVLSSLDVYDVIYEIYEMLPEPQKMLWEITNCPCWANKHVHIALICYEKTSDFCHRHLVADWLNKNGIECKEWQS